MKNKELILILEELKQQVEECRDRDSSPYIDGLLRRTDFIINSLSVNNGVLDGVISCKNCGSDKTKLIIEKRILCNDCVCSYYL